MTSTRLRELQAPFKDKYKSDPASAMLTLRAVGEWVPMSPVN